jgi:hypothetical protein
VGAALALAAPLALPATPASVAEVRGEALSEGCGVSLSSTE